MTFWRKMLLKTKHMWLLKIPWNQVAQLTEHSIAPFRYRILHHLFFVPSNNIWRKIKQMAWNQRHVFAPKTPIPSGSVDGTPQSLVSDTLSFCRKGWFRWIKDIVLELRLFFKQCALPERWLAKVAYLSHHAVIVVVVIVIAVVIVISIDAI